MCAVETIALLTCLSLAGLKMRVEMMLGHCLILERNFLHLQVKRYFSQPFTPKAILNLQVKHFNTSDSFCSLMLGYTCCISLSSVQP